MRFPYDDDIYAYADETASDTDDYDQEEFVDQICFDENQNNDSEKTTGSYYIGSVFQDDGYAVLGLAVSARTFYKYELSHVERYLYEFSYNIKTQPFMDIIKLDILPDLTYACIVKTHWLRLVQRHWKRTFALRKEILEKRRTMDAIKYFELYGKYMDNLRILPTIRGLMQGYRDTGNLRFPCTNPP